MPARHVSIALSCAWLCILACSCRRSIPHAPATAPSDVTLELDLKPLTPLLPARPTHVAVDSTGNVYWVQENDRGDDVLFAIGQSEIPRATELSVGNITAALNAAGAKGNIQAIAAAPGGDIYFYFSGSLGRKMLAALGIYHARSATIHILADTDAVAAATGMGLSLALARGTLVTDGRLIWLWIRHTDDWSIFKIDPRAVPPQGPITLKRAFDSVKLGGKAIALTRDDMNLAVDGDATLFLPDPSEGRLLKIADDGTATVAQSLIGLPSALSTPTVDRQGKMWMFAANAALIHPPLTAATLNAPPTPAPQIALPAMLIFDGSNMSWIDRDHIQSLPGFAVFDVKLRRLVADSSSQSWIAYDAGSGELLRLTIQEKTWK